MPRRPRFVTMGAIVDLYTSWTKCRMCIAFVSKTDQAVNEMPAQQIWKEGTLSREAGMLKTVIGSSISRCFSHLHNVLCRNCPITIARFNSIHGAVVHAIDPSTLVRQDALFRHPLFQRRSLSGSETFYTPSCIAGRPTDRGKNATTTRTAPRGARSGKRAENVQDSPPPLVSYSEARPHPSPPLCHATYA